jgi:phosphoribosylglycinamide formyltransferase-1
MSHPRVAILISGRGSNMASLIAAAADPAYPAEVVLVLSNRPEAPGLEIAAAHGVPTEVLDHKAFPYRQAFDSALDERLKAAKVDLVCLAGFMRILSPPFVDAWPDRLLNIHPSLLPAFPGIDTHARALAAGVKLHGATVHYLRPGLDDGPIIAQAAVPVISADTVDSLAARVLAAEHRLYPLALALVARGEAKVVDERVVIEGVAATGPSGVLYSPPAPDL